MSRFPVFYLPSLHAELAPADLPGDVLFCPAGLEAALPGEPPAALQEAREKLPLDTRAAKAVLSDMLELGFALGPEKAAGVAAPRSFRRPEVEAEALKNFSRSGQGPKPPQEKGEEREITPLDCQKLLLLAHELEERWLEMLEIELELQTSEENLTHWLGEGPAEELLEDMEDTDHEEEPGDQDAPGDNAGLLPDWRLVAASALAFLPEDAALISAHHDMAAYFLEAGLLGPLPEDVRENLAHWPEEFVGRLQWAHLPGWRLTGRARPLPQRPWLAAGRHILIYHPKDEHNAE